MRQNPYILMVAGLSVALMALSACSSENGEGGKNGGNPGNTQRSPTYAVRGVVQDIDGRPIQNAAVVAKKATATTDAEGRYQLRLPEGDAVIQFAKSNYMGTLKKVTVSKEHPTMLHVKLLHAAPAKTFDAGDGGFIEGTGNRNGTVRAEFPENAFVDKKGNRVSGRVSVRLTNIDASDEAQSEAAPGSFIAVDEDGSVVQLESGGMLSIDVRDASGEKLQLAPGVEMDVRFPVTENLGAPFPMELWSFDEEAGQWVKEEGVLTLVEDGDERYYTTKLPHMSFWNCDRPLEATCVSGCAKDAQTGQPLAGAHVFVSGVDYVGSSQATTGADGCFRVAVRQNSTIRVTVQHKLGGGVSREATSGGSSTPVPPTSSTECENVGEFIVERDVFDYDGMAMDCTAEMMSIRGEECQEEFGAMFACWRTAGDCTINISSTTGSSSMRWDSGARMVTDINSDGSLTMLAYQDGELCYSMEYSLDDSGNENEFSMAYTYKDAQGKEFKMEIEMENNGYKQTVECPSGKKFEMVMTEVERAAMSACQAPQEANTACTIEIEGLEFCQSAGDCEQDEICCDLNTFSYCIEEDFEETCTLMGGTPR